jgi:hypothetical protein
MEGRGCCFAHRADSIGYELAAACERKGMFVLGRDSAIAPARIMRARADSMRNEIGLPGSAEGEFSIASPNRGLIFCSDRVRNSCPYRCRRVRELPFVCLLSFFRTFVNALLAFFNFDNVEGSHAFFNWTMIDILSCYESGQ